jgi:hypothetical protein
VPGRPRRHRLLPPQGHRLRVVDHDRHGAYVAIAKAQLTARGVGAAVYAGADMADYDLIGQADCVFNRLIVYRNHVLHSALLGRGAAAPIPATGRLTANGFIEAVTPDAPPSTPSSFSSPLPAALRAFAARDGRQVLPCVSALACGAETPFPSDERDCSMMLRTPALFGALLASWPPRLRAHARRGPRVRPVAGQGDRGLRVRQGRQAFYEVSRGGKPVLAPRRWA